MRWDSPKIATRIGQYTREYLENITPPFTRALFNYVQEGKYTFCTPGHMGGSAYQKSPVGCLFYDFFGGNTLKADVSISVTELGSLLDHTGPHLEAEEYIARAFGAEQSYMVTNGTSTSNKIVGMYSAPAARIYPRQHSAESARHGRGAVARACGDHQLHLRWSAL